MKIFKNKTNIICKKFLCSTLITLFAILGGISITSFASAEPPPPDPPNKTLNSITIDKTTIDVPTHFWKRLTFWLFDEFLSPVVNIILRPFRFLVGRIPDPESMQRIHALEFRMDQMMNQTYPVGSIYISVNHVSPAELFGGVWERWGNGRVPVGVNSTQSEFSSVEQTGGEKMHTLSYAELPVQVYADLPGSNLWIGESGGCWAHNRAGGGHAHNNLQPYITCYMWKRVA